MEKDEDNDADESLQRQNKRSASPPKRSAPLTGIKKFSTWTGGRNTALLCGGQGQAAAGAAGRCTEKWGK